MFRIVSGIKFLVGFPEWFRNGSGNVPYYVPEMFLKVFPFLLLLTFFCFGLPFSRENTDQLLIFNYLFAEGKSI